MFRIAELKKKKTKAAEPLDETGRAVFEDGIARGVRQERERYAKIKELAKTLGPKGQKAMDYFSDSGLDITVVEMAAENFRRTEGSAATATGAKDPNRRFLEKLNLPADEIEKIFDEIDEMEKRYLPGGGEQ